MSARRRWGLLVTVGIGLLLVALDNSVLYTALPTLTEQLGASTTQGLWIINAYPLVVAGLLLGSGTLGDRVGHRRMFFWGLVIFGSASLAAAFAPTAEALIAGRAVLGIGAAAMMPATLALIRITFADPRERNIAIAVWGSLAVVGAALGPILGGALLQYFWWGSIFLINVPVVIGALIAVSIIAPPNVRNPDKSWDAVSSAQIMIGLVGTVLTIKELAHSPQNWPLIGGAVLAAAVGFTLFARRQRRLPEPLLDFGLFRNPAFTAGVIAAAGAMFAIAGVELLTTQRFQLVDGMTPLRAGVLVALVAIGSLPTSLIGGAVVHRTGMFPLIAGGLGVAAVGVVAVIGAVHTDSVAAVVGGLLMTGAGLGATMSVASIAIVGNAPAPRAGMASSMEEVSYEFGSLTAVALLGSLLTVVYSATLRVPAGSPAGVEGQSLTTILAEGGGSPIVVAAREAFDNGYSLAMAVAAAVLVAASVATGVLLRRRPATSEVTREYASVH